MTTRNRGKKSNDDRDFAPRWHPVFKEAVDDVGFLLSRDYADNSVLQLVGNRYRLNKRQRSAIQRISSSQQEIAQRQKTALPKEALESQSIEIDGFNLLILLESAMSGAFVFKGRDGTYRDLSSVHGSYKRVQKTADAIYLVGRVLKSLKVKSVLWYLDQPVSNSGRLKSQLLEISSDQDFNWEVELVFSPDKALAQSEAVVISSDGWILNHCQRWYNLGSLLLEKHLKDVNVIEV